MFSLYKTFKHEHRISKLSDSLIYIAKLTQCALSDLYKNIEDINKKLEKKSHSKKRYVKIKNREKK